MNKESFYKLIENLKDIDYFFISGFAVHVLSEGKRSFHDFDIAISEKDIERFASRVNAIVNKRLINKGTFIVDDCGFEVSFEGIDIECTSGYPKLRVVDKKFDKLFFMKLKKNFLGRDIYIAPIKEIIVQKAFMYREKDIEDLKLLRNLDFSNSLVSEIAVDWGDRERIFKNLQAVGFALQ